MQNSKSTIELKRRYQDRVEYVGNTQRLRMVPGNYTPLSAGVIVFTAVTAIAFLAYHLSISQFDLPDPGMLIKLGVASCIGLITGIYDFRYTLKGNERGRWDLILDRPNGTLQVPALGAYGEPNTLRLDDIVRLQLRTLVGPDPSEGTKGIYRLSVVCHHQFGNPGDPISREEFTDHAIAQSSDDFQLKAMASWLEDLLEMRLEVEEVDADFSLTSTIKELYTSQ